MPTFVLMTKLSPKVAKDPKKRERLGREWKDEVDQKCPNIRWLKHFALLGPYDFMDIFEASSEEEAAKVSMISQSLGATKAESWTAIPYSRFMELSAEI